MKIIFTALIIILAAALYSCKDNPINTTNVNHTNDTIVLFTKDSIYSIAYHGTDSVIFNTTVSIDTLYISFNLHCTNTSNLFCSIRSDEFYNEYRQFYSVYNFDTTFYYKYPLTKHLNFSVLIASGGIIGMNSYASLHNIKLWYIKRD